MASIRLAKADLALMGDLNRRVTLPRLSSVQPVETWNGTAVRFAGDTLPTPFFGEGGETTLAITCRFASYEQQTAADLVALLRTARASADTRLWLRTNYGQASGLDFAGAVVVLSVEPVPTAGLVVDVSFTATAVAYSLAV